MSKGNELRETPHPVRHEGEREEDAEKNSIPNSKSWANGPIFFRSITRPAKRNPKPRNARRERKITGRDLRIITALRGILNRKTPKRKTMSMSIESMSIQLRARPRRMAVRLEGERTFVSNVPLWSSLRTPHT